MAETSKTMLKLCGESGHPCLVLLTLKRGNAFNFSPMRIMFAVGLSYVAFIMLRYAFYACFLEGFYHKWMLNFVKGLLSVFILKGIGLHLCQLKRLHSYVNSFLDVKSTLNSSDKSHLDVLMDLIGFYFVEDF